MRRCKKFLIWLTSTLLILNGCSFYRISDSVPLSWPGDGLAVFGGGGLVSWDLSWLDADGSVSRRRVDAGERPFITLPRERPAIVCALPVTPSLPEIYQTRPAGCIVHAAVPRPSELSLTWDQGFSAVFLLSLAEAGVPPDSINLRRFQEVLEIRSEGNPWNIDLRRLSGDLLGGELWTYSFRLLPSVDVLIPLPPGAWYSEYPPSPVLISESGIWAGKLTVGMHNFIRPLDFCTLSVSVDERGHIAVLSD
jgi:hypothetical protein